MNMKISLKELQQEALSIVKEMFGKDIKNTDDQPYTKLYADGFIYGFRSNPNTYTKGEVQALLEEQIKLAAEAAKVKSDRISGISGMAWSMSVDKESILNCPCVKLD